MRLYKFLYSVVIPIVRAMFRVKVVGRENIPDEPVLICANHASLWDAFVAISPFGKDDPIAVLGKIELFRMPIIGRILRAIGAIPVNRGATDISTLREAIEDLKNGRKVLIFPEGTRVKGDEVSVEGAKTGAAMIACRANAKILPVFITPQKRFLKQTTVIIGKPVDTSEFEGRGSAKYKAVVECVFGEILRLGNGGEE